MRQRGWQKRVESRSERRHIYLKKKSEEERLVGNMGKTVFVYGKLGKV
jgi:hypothetical protein